jgi:hypothetical protein
LRNLEYEPQKFTTMNKSKLKWKYAYEPYNLLVRRGGEKTEVRVCAYGYDEQGLIRSTLYCTRDGIFMQRTLDGWKELKPATCPANLRSKSGKGSPYPRMFHFGNLHCHKLVCTAFHGERPEGYECDHINGSNLDWSADNLRWVTTAENIRCACYLKRLRKHGIDPKRIRYSLLLALYDLTWERFEECLQLFDKYCNADSSPLSELAINVNLHQAFMNVLTKNHKSCQEKQER